MNITKKRLKEIIMEEVKTLTEAGDYHDFGDPAELEDISKQQEEEEEEKPKANFDRHGPDAKRDKDGNRINPKLKKEDIARIIYEETVKAIKEGRFTGGQIDIVPLSDEEQEASTEAYYDLHDHLMQSLLPGNKPSEKMIYALRWIAKFESGATYDGPRNDDVPPVGLELDPETLEEGVVDMDGETVITGPDGDASPEARGLARQDDLQATMMKAALEIKNNMPQKAYETLLRALAAAGIEGGEDLPGLEEYRGGATGSANKGYRSGATGSANKGYRGGPDAEQSKKRQDGYRGDSSTSPNRNKYRGGR